PRSFAGTSEDDIDIGDAAVRDPGLFSVQNIAAAVAPCGQGNIGHIRAGLLLGQRERGDGFTAARAREPTSLLRVAKKADRASAQALHRKSKIGERVVPRQRLANEAKRTHIEWRRAARIGRGMSEPAVAPEAPHQPAAGGIEITACATNGTGMRD